MKKAPLAVLAILLSGSLFLSGATAQTPEEDAPPPPPPPTEKPAAENQGPVDPCPRITLKAPNQPVRDGVPVRIAVNLAGGDGKVAPMFDWSISAGVIRTGQGTASIEVDTTGAGRDRAIYATVLLGGFSPECISSETAIVPIAGPAQKVDEFGSLSDEEMAARVDSSISSASPTDHFYVVAYAGRTNVRGYASATLRQIRTRALKSGIPAERLVTMDGGFREEAAFELWIVPLGSEAPKPTPTVNPRDIVFARPTPPERKRP